MSDLVDVTRQATAGGVTTVLAYMRQRESYLDALPEWEAAINSSAVCDVGFHLQIQSRKHIDEIPSYHAQYGIGSFKVHIDYRRPIGALDIQPVDDGEVFLALRAVRHFDGLVAVHCEDTEIARYLQDEAVGSGLGAWADIRPPLVEAADVNNVAYIASQVGARVLFVHISTAASIEVLRLHNYSRAVVEVLARHLTMAADEADDRLGRWGKVNPPIRSSADVEGLWDAVRAGDVDFIGTDHSAYSGDVPNDPPRTLDDFWVSGPRASGGIGVALPLMLTAARRRGISLPLAAELMSGRVASTFRLPTKGRIVIGADADLTVVDMEKERVVEIGMPASPTLCVANGMSLIGWPVLTILRGRIVFDEHGWAAPGHGSVVRFGDP